VVHGRDVARIPLQLTRGIVVASIQVDLDDDVVHQFQQDLLERVQTSGARGVVLDLSALETLDAHEFAALRRLITMASIMGAQAVLCGLRPGVVSALIDTEANVDGVLAAAQLEHALFLLEQEEPPTMETDEDTESDEEPPAESDDPSAEVPG
jgi:rsbT antagonist protein RsbS